MSEEILHIDEMESVFRTEADPIFFYLQGLSRNPDLAADLLQTVFMKFIESVRGGHIRRETAGAYLRTMARNQFYEHCRRDRNETELPDEVAAVPESSATENDELPIRIRHAFMDCLDTAGLSEEMQAVLRLRLLGETAVEDICESLERSRATVYRLMEKGLSLMARCFEVKGLTLEEMEG